MEATLLAPFEEWAQIYRPISNSLVARLEYGGRYFGLTAPEVEAAQQAANAWTLVSTAGDLEIRQGFFPEKALGYFITEEAETSHSGLFVVLGRPEEVTPARDALALEVAREDVLARLAEEHVRDMRALESGHLTRETFETNETSRKQQAENVRVFFNPWSGEYVIEETRFENLLCGRCGTGHPGDPCRGCGRVQPLSDEEHYRANTRVVELPQPVEPVALVPGGEDNDGLPY